MLNPQIFVQKNVPFIKRLMGDTPGETAFVRWRLARIFKELGFAAVDISPFDFLHPWTPAPLLNAVRQLGSMAEKIPVIREIAGSLVITGQK
jgi:hypothetical protein